MALDNLTEEQSIRSARLFINNFGLKLDEQKSNESNYKILNTSNEEVGELYFDNNFIKVEATCPFGLLLAEYEKNNQGGIDNINFKILKNKHEKQQGLFSVQSSIDIDGVKNVEIKPSIKYFIDDKQIYDFIIIGSKNCFAIAIGDKDGYEIIQFKPDNLNHKKYTSDEIIETEVLRLINDMYAQYRIIKNDKIICIGDLGKQKIAPSKEERTKQMINIMKNVNPSISEKTNNLKSVLVTPEVDIINNYIIACFPINLQDSAFELLDISKKEVVYQNETTDLVSAYFDTDSKKILQKTNKKDVQEGYIWHMDN